MGVKRWQGGLDALVQWLVHVVMVAVSIRIGD